MATYRVLVYIPMITHPPHLAQPVPMSQANKTRALNSAVALKKSMATYSNNLCQLDVELRFVHQTLTEPQYAELSGQRWLSPGRIATFLGDTNKYDIYVVYDNPDATNVTT